jgi:hypothetical protein
MYIVLLIAGLHAFIFAWCFLTAAVLTFAAHDQKPLDRDTRLLLVINGIGGGSLVHGFAIVRNWRQCPQARKFFYAGLAFGSAAWALNSLAIWLSENTVANPSGFR